MTLLLDPSMLVGSRARTWLQRAHQRGVLHQVSIPTSIFSADAGDLRPRSSRFPGYRPEPHLDLLHQARQVCYSGEPLPAAAYERPDVPVLALDTWAALLGGATLVARRTDVLDSLVAAGVELHVRSCLTEQDTERTLLAQAWPQVPVELAEALSRRTRLLARTVEPSTTAGELVVEVWDKGPFGIGPWR